MSTRIIALSSLALTLIMIILFSLNLINDKASIFELENIKDPNQEKDFSANVFDFGATGDGNRDDSKSIQDTINDSQKNSNGIVTLNGNRSYLIKSGLVIKEGVELRLDQNTKVLVDGNFKAITLEKNASISGGTIEVINSSFQSDLIYLDGKHEYYGIWHTNQVRNIKLINSSGALNGTALNLFSSGESHQITFLNFDKIGISGFHTGVKLETVDPGNNKYSWINGNTLENFSMERCISFIELIGNASIPNEASGNVFSNLQIQLDSDTKSVLKVDGSLNEFEGIIWDTHVLSHQDPLVELTINSKSNKVSTNLEQEYTQDQGTQNKISIY